MGTVFSLPIVRSENVVADLVRMKEWGVETVATVVKAGAVPLTVLASAMEAHVAGKKRGS